MSEDRKPVVAPEHLRPQKKRRYAKRIAPGGFLGCRGKDPLRSSVVKHRLKPSDIAPLTGFQSTLQPVSDWRSGIWLAAKSE
jgi:hypothetical protein